MSNYDTPYVFKPIADNGSLRASKSKRTEISPDYYGVISIDLENLTNIKKENGLTIVKLSGWKKKDKSGNTYLSLAVDRYVPKQSAPVSKDIDDIPF
jgi:hypothetical protein